MNSHVPASTSERLNPFLDHSYNQRTIERVKIPNQYHNELSENQTEPQGNNEHPYALPNTGIPTQTQVPPARESMNQIFPPDTSQQARAAKPIPNFCGKKWDGLHGKKTSHLTVGSLNVEGMGKCKTIQVANMCDSLDMDIFATIEHHQDDTHFRGTSSSNNKSMAITGV